MKYLTLLFVAFFFNGCLYFNDEGVSTRLYSDGKEYYDAEGNYIKECPKNLVNYSDLEE